MPHLTKEDYNIIEVALKEYKKNHKDNNFEWDSPVVHATNIIQYINSFYDEISNGWFTSDENNDFPNIDSLMHLCSALGVSYSIVRELSNFEPAVFDIFGEKETITILTENIGDRVEMFLITDISDKEYKVCSLCPGEEGFGWRWAMEYIRNIIECELIKRKLNYKIKTGSSYVPPTLPF